MNLKNSSTEKNGFRKSIKRTTTIGLIAATILMLLTAFTGCNNKNQAPAKSAEQITAEIENIFTEKKESFDLQIIMIMKIAIKSDADYNISFLDRDPDAPKNTLTKAHGSFDISKNFFNKIYKMAKAKNLSITEHNEGYEFIRIDLTKKDFSNSENAEILNIILEEAKKANSNGTLDFIDNEAPATNE